ncbi:MAG: hypothetical protein ACRC56_11980 [Bosea sp. (in: a-proteobacteria)]
MTTMTLQIEGRIAPPLASRRERFLAWVRAAHPFGAKQYARLYGVDLRTAEGRFDGRLPSPDEEDRLIEIHGDEYIGPVIYPALMRFIQKQEARRREISASIELGQARLRRAADLDRGEADGSGALGDGGER